jgi:hypothetical protein
MNASSLPSSPVFLRILLSFLREMLTTSSGAAACFGIRVFGALGVRFAS